MTTQQLLLVVHIAGVSAWLGANFVQLVLSPRLAKEGAAVAAAWTRQTMWLGERYYTAAGAVIAITGVLLVWHGHWSWSSGFIWVGAGVIVIGAVLGVAAFTPLATARVTALEAGDEAAADAAQGRIIPLGLVDTLLVLTAVYAMVHRWAA